MCFFEFSFLPVELSETGCSFFPGNNVKKSVIFLALCLCFFVSRNSVCVFYHRVFSLANNQHSLMNPGHEEEVKRSPVKKTFEIKTANPNMIRF